MSQFFLLFFIIVGTYIWFETNAFIEYCRLFKISKLYKQYDAYYSAYPKMHLSFPDFLLLRRNNFFTRLIGCELCLIVWLNLLIVWFTNVKFIAMGFTTFVSWVGYHFLKFIVKKANE